MKKTLIALLAISGMSMGETTTVIDLTKTQQFSGANVTYTAPATGTINGVLTGTGIWQSGGGGRPHTALTFVVDLDKLTALTEQTTLVTVDTNSSNNSDVGLIWGQYSNVWGIEGNWQGNPWPNSGGAFVAGSDLNGYKFSVADSNDKFVTLTMTVANTTGDQGGEQLYPAGNETSLFTNATKLGGGSTGIDQIVFDTRVISAVAITPGWAPGDIASTLGTALQTAFIAAHNVPVPEPTTGTLSLLALAGLCARRRKK